MKQEINPKETSRARAFEMWMSSPMPMVTLTKTFDVSRIITLKKEKELKFNMLLCWCIGKAACWMEEFYLLPEHGKLYRFDQLAINVIVDNIEGGINSCDIPWSDDLVQFSNDYDRLTISTSTACKSNYLEGTMVIGTSAMTATELDCIVNQYTKEFCNPFVAWGKYRNYLIRTTLPISFQFHHVQMDGGRAAMFLDELQRTIYAL